MATSLAAQLAQISAKSKTTLNTKAQKAAHSKSLIWEPRIAASQSFQTIYNACYSGFEELCELDERFVPFRSSLFSEESQNEDRIQLTDAENTQLDKKVEVFLRLVASRLRLMPAIKAIEWLIRRFRIHEFSTSSLITAFLPYHTIPAFVTLLSILPPRVPTEYRFLDPYIRSLTAPPRTVIVAECINHPAFLVHISEYTIESARKQVHYQTLISFWGGLMTEAVNGVLEKSKTGRRAIQEDNNQNILHRLGPIFGESLVLRKVPQLQIAAYMALAVFISKGSWGDTTVAAFMEQVVTGWTSETIRPGLVCLAILAQYRSPKQVPGRVAKALLKIPNLEAQLLELSSHWRVDRLANGLCLALIDRSSRKGDARGLPIILALLKAGTLTAKQTLVLFKALLLAATRLDESADSDGAIRKELGSMLLQLSQDTGSCGEAFQQAMEAVDFDLDELEMKLDFTLRRQKLIEDAAGEVEADGNTEVKTITNPTQDVRGTLDKWQSKSKGLSATLSSNPGEVFDDLVHVFLVIMSSELGDAKSEIIDKFESIPVLASTKAASSCTFFAFLLRISCGPYPALARQAALTMIKNRLKAEKGAIDFQNLLPYCLAALSDPSRKVRQAAADLVVVMNTFYPEETKTSRLSVWGTANLYDGAPVALPKWQPLTTDLALRTVRLVLLPILEECVMESDRILSTLEMVLDPRKSAASGPEDKKGRLSQSARLSLFSFLAAHATCTPLLSAREQLLGMLNRVRSIGSITRTHPLLPALRWWLSLAAGQASQLCAAANVSEDELDARFVNVVVPSDEEGVDTLVKVIASYKEGDARAGLARAIFARIRKIWPAIKPETKAGLAIKFLGLAQPESIAEIPENIREEATSLLQNVELSTDVLSSFLDSIKVETTLATESPAMKRRRTSSTAASRGVAIQTGPEILSALRRATFVLQLVDSSNPAAHPQLMNPLFGTLLQLQHFRTLVGSELGYLQNIILRSLLVIMPAHSDAADFKMIDRAGGYGDMLVNCIQKSTSLAVQNAALLLIAGLASTAPELIIHSVMDMFTVLGTSVLRQSDDYSAHVLNQTIKQVIPPLLGTLRKSSRNIVSAAVELLANFTTSYQHMPQHRRLGLFNVLVETLGAQEFLFAVVAMLLDKYDTSENIHFFVGDLLHGHSIQTQLDTLIKLVALVDDVFQAQPTVSKTLLGLSADEEKNRPRLIALRQLSALPGLLANKSFDAQIRRITEQDDMAASEVRELYARLLESILAVDQTVRDDSELHDACGEALANLLNILPIGEFIKAVESLLDRPSVGLRHKVLKALEIRINRETNTDATSRSVLLGFLPQLTAAIRDSTDIRYKHTAISCVDKIAEKYGRKDIEAVTAAAATIAGDDCLGQADGRLRVMSLLCLASLVDVLQDAIVPVLPEAFSRALSYISVALEEKGETGSELHDACFTFILAVSQRLPYMISASTLQTILAKADESVEADIYEDGVSNRNACLKCLAKQIEAKSIFSALSKGWDHAAKTGFLAVNQYIDTLGTALDKQSKSSVSKNIPALSELFLNAFDLRRQTFKRGQKSDAVVAAISATEDKINATALKMIFKLNDAAFRPLFSQIMEWTAQLPKSDKEGRCLRSQSVYGFLFAFFDGLKSIVTSYSTYVVDDAVQVLKQTEAKGSVEQRRLWERVLRVLEVSFKHDQDDFWQAPAHFSAIAPVLVQQFAHASSMDLDTYLVPALVELAGVADSQASQKELNSSILKQLRSEEAAVRLAAIKAEQAMTDRHGEEWLAMLPEMLPYISELQDDDDEVVERETHRWIVKIEGILGESLDSMLQ